MRMHKPEYLKAKKRIQTLNRSIAQRRRNLIWTNWDELTQLEGERDKLQAEVKDYEQWYKKSDEEFDRQFWATSPAIQWGA